MNVYHCFPGGRFKALTMSYDDGTMEDERLVAIFNKYGIKSTFNINSGLLGRPKRLPREKVRDVYEGHEIATHCYTHPTISRCPLVEVAGEILKDREALEALTGGLVRGHAYPNGSYSEEIKDLFKKMGIAYGRVIKALPDGIAGYALPNDPLEWQPTCHHNDSRLMEKGRWLLDTDAKQYLMLMYVWGHSYEFTNDNNWEVIENFCRLMGGQKDIWYATNIEIIDYMEVMKGLKFSADGEKVFNPSVQSAWLAVNDDIIVEVPGGELVNLANMKE